MRRIRFLLPPAVAVCLLVAVSLVSAERGSPNQTLAPGSGRVGIYLTSHALSVPEIVTGFMEAKESGKLNTLVINVKNMHGELTYASDVLIASEIGASTGRVDFRLLLPELRRRGFYVIARHVLFFDPLLAAHLGFPNDWVPADHPTAVAYNLAIAEEIAGFGFDEIQFDYIRFADEGDLVPAYESRYAAVESFLEEAGHRVGERALISVDLFGRVLWSWNTKRIDPIGQSLEGICPLVDFVSPMLYPSHYSEDTYRNDPYRTISDALTEAHQRVTASFRPFLQAFDLRLPEDMALDTYIEEQIDAARACGADGYLFWHPACDYTALYKVL